MVDILKGGIASDQRGNIRFVNDFDMSGIKRFYIIKNVDTETVRGWRAHRIEQRWFYVLSGSFILDLVVVDNWNSASRNLPVERKILTASDLSVIHIPQGYGTAIQSLEEESELLVFADHDIKHATLDDYTWPKDYFLQRGR
ncbi:WxcM-like domain-containing protein [Leadbetterella sp. DM7]|uniref:WxcM-like domain-containing protein n=1 Tax=Leadbetterella sp. DM7 TaxID=3235085 RepID=UPI00349E7D62